MMRSKWVPVFWAVGMVCGAVGLRFGIPEHYSVVAASLMGSEEVHVGAHLILYGTQTLLVWTMLGPDARWMLGIPLATGMIQEFSQTLGQRNFGSGELFDLGVDLTAIGSVLIISRLYQRYYKVPCTDHRHNPPA